MLGQTIWHMMEVCVKGCLKLFFRLIHKELTDDVVQVCLQFVKFGMVGLSNTILSYAIYALLLMGLQTYRIFPQADYLIAQIVAFVISVAWSFYWNNRMVFTLNEGEERSIWRSLLKNYVAYSFTGLFLNSILLILWVQICHISEFIAPIINLLFSVPLNFLINKFWAFKKK